MGVLSFFVSYFLGAIPFSYLLPKMLKDIDVRNLGSHNVGTSNAVYTSGMKVGLLCFLGDFSKGYLAYYLASNVFGLDGWMLIFSSLAAVIGHNWNIFLKFKGGKGMATAWGVIFASNYIAGLLFLLYATIITLSTKYISMGTIFGITLVWVTSFFPIFDFNSILIVSLILIIIPKHLENFKKIKNGTEYKINERM
ncbi:glycerol-3-phosphate 1-O-acyltransferase PlsY [Geotoga petraea]|uniref:Glycerol-3-phosphate acyltransferase n=1 Tax=Geotoga petraea TaxID=28234 RepID=A0A1G6PWG3_9BACT|nr:glycerol-3-phosphate 1-O-acyltransferase PlsY [Geotoga petraea]MDK2946465.1 acyl phosphate:glycerol-3-phosphate acyltransferase [Geotoga sp.]TGG86846.1 glycerol-3-phosphate 1-O-acyltransferase [Geotoga petraea]SDC84463.1 acyl-phosphate glycerol-3-phosphate acyltransferase [Geotoga petraea]